MKVKAPPDKMVNEFVNRLIDEGIENRNTAHSSNHNYRCFNVINFEDFCKIKFRCSMPKLIK